ncbi:MAG: alpha/beta fold hydrolase [Planctomycetota bacterium]
MTECVVKTYRTRRGEALHYRMCEASPSKGLIVCLHGIQSHGGWYVEGARALVSRNFSVALLDRRGSGLNREDRGDTPTARTLLDDIDDAIDQVNVAGGPVVLMGISWGGKLASVYAAERGGRLAGLILSAPGIAAKVDLAFPQKLMVALGSLLAPRRTFPVPIPDETYFTANPERLAYIREDALSVRQVTGRFLLASRKLDRMLARGADRIRVPTLLLLAGKERIVDTDGVRRFYEGLRAPKTLVSFGEAHHTLEFEVAPEPYFDAIAGWLERVVG